MVDFVRRCRVLIEVLAFLIFLTAFQPSPTGPNPIRSSSSPDATCVGSYPVT